MTAFRVVLQVLAPSVRLVTAPDRWYANFGQTAAILAARVIRAAAWLAIFSLVMGVTAKTNTRPLLLKQYSPKLATTPKVATR